MIQQDITDLQTIATDHETRIDDLEATNPEALRGLSDVLFPTLDVTQNDKIIAYDSTSDKFILRSDNSGLPDADIDGTPYLREDGTWIQLTTTNAFIDVDTRLGTAEMDITNLQNEQITQNTNITNLQIDVTAIELALPTIEQDINDIQAEQITQNGDILNLQTDLGNLALNDLNDVDPALAPTNGQVLTYNTANTQWESVTPATGSSSLATLTDVNLGTLSNGDMLSYDLANSEWVNSGLSLTPATPEYMQFKSITGTCEISPNTTGEFGISNAIGFFTATPTAGTCIFDTSASAGIISVTNTK